MKKWSCLVFCSFFIAKGLNAENTDCIESSCCYPEDGIACCCPTAKIFVSHLEGSGIGFSKGYSTLGFFSQYYNCQKRYQPFFDVRGHIFNDGKWAANGAFGVRKWGRRFLLGGYVAYDYRRFVQHNFSQIGLGVEALGNCWSFRANGYLPVGSKEKKSSLVFDTFKEHDIIVKRNSRLAMAGFDLDLERDWQVSENAHIIFGAGPYFFQGKFGKNALGGKARFFASLYDFIFLGTRLSYDQQFGFNAAGEIRLELPLNFWDDFFCFNKCSRKVRNCLLNTRILERQEIVVVSKNQSKKFVAKSINDNPFFVVHVNNTAAVGGIGTFEQPFNTLLGAQNNSNPGDIIYVNAGNGTTSGMSTGITLKNHQKFWGSGISHLIDTEKGLVEIPSTTFIFPVITNTTAGGNGITLANNNQVEGFVISNTNNHGISSTNPTIASIIRSNRIINTGTGGGAQAGIRVVLAPGINVFSTLVIANNFISSNQGANDGVFISQTAGATPLSLNIAFENNQVVTNPSMGFFIQRPAGTSNTFFLSGVFQNNEVSNNGAEGLFFQNLGTTGITFDLHINNNRFFGNAAAGVNVDEAFGYINLQNNLFNGNGGVAGCFINTIGTQQVSIDCLNNIFANSTNSGIEFQSDGSSIMNINFITNIGINNDFEFDSNATSTIFIRMSDNDGALTATGNIILLP